MRDIKFACPHCEQHIKCDDTFGGQKINCPACGREVVVPKLADENRLRTTTGHVPIPTQAHGAPRSGKTSPPVGPAPPEYSKLAIASISLSIASLLLGPLGCIPGIILGYLAKAQIRQNPRLQGLELAQAGIIVGYCFLALLAAYGVWHFTNRAGGH